MVLVLYIALLVAALFLGLVSIFAGGSPAWLAVAVLLVAFVPLLPAMLFYWRFVACKTVWGAEMRQKHPGRIAEGRLLPACGQAAAWEYCLSKPPSSGVTMTLPRRGAGSHCPPAGGRSSSAR